MMFVEEVTMFVCGRCRSSVCCVVLFLCLCIFGEASVCVYSCIVVVYVFY